MTSLKIPFNHQPSPASNSSQSGTAILWREWRTCEDEEYARHLFDLVADESVDRPALVILGLLGALSGGLAGGWLTQWLDGTSLAAILGFGLALVSGGLLAMLAPYLKPPTWQTWLQGLLSPTFLAPFTSQDFKSVADKFGLPAALLNLLHFWLPAALASSLGVGLTGMLFFDQNNPGFGWLLAALGLLCGAGFWAARPASGIKLALSLLASLAFGLFFGLGFAQLAGLALGPFDAADSARWVGLGVGLGAGFFLGREAGLLSTLTWQGLLTAGAAGWMFFGGTNLVLFGWLAGFMVGSLAGSLSRVWGFSAGQFAFTEAYAYRAWYLWWFSRPPASEVESTLRRHATGPEWGEAFRCLNEQLPRDGAGEAIPAKGKKQTSRRKKKQPRQPVSAEAVWSYLERPDWADRFVGRHTLAALGGEAIPYLLTRVGTHPLRRTAAWLIRSIGCETTQRLAGQAHQVRCPFCLACGGPHPAKHTGLSVTYYGCRICGQSRYFLTCPQGVAAVLDNTWADEHSYEAGLLRVNWLVRRSLFDFDRVEIVQATDEEVERFAVQVGNDTDPFRQSRYSQLSCLVDPACQLSENTLRILQRTFGVVEHISK